jgi:dihydrofolate reductase
MIKVTSGLFISMDGVVESPHLWQFDVFDEAMERAMVEFIAGIDTVLIGRVTYQEWADYWPNAAVAGVDEDYARFINDTPKYVASTTLDRVDWSNSILVKGDFGRAVARLKEEPGANIGVQGSPTLARYLLNAGLLDELTLMIHPVIAGRGKRLFHDGDELKRMRLVDSTVTPSGVAFLTYRPLTADH